MQQVDLFVIDGQNDFCASGAEPEGRRGALYVEGADREAEAVAGLIRRLTDGCPGYRLRKIHATLDNHHRNDGSHHIAWMGPDGAPPPPFTVVTSADVAERRWVPRFETGIWEGREVSSYEWALHYTAALEETGRSPLTLWPVHCQIATWGSNVYEPLREAFDHWCDATAGWVDFLPKGQWVWTEHYSGLKADVPEPTRPETQLNTAVLEDAMQADLILWTGWAGSHCLRWTALDAANHFGPGENALLKKSIFFRDASAPVPDIPGAPFRFSDWRREFLEEMSRRGAVVTTIPEWLATL